MCASLKEQFDAVLHHHRSELLAKDSLEKAKHTGRKDELLLLSEDETGGEEEEESQASIKSEKSIKDKVKEIQHSQFRVGR